ncbi:MAG: hypothetical protein GTN99_11280 [Candidatus Dadabacteria bacterium]|nr:hypothetical protein [Candidatus Dadabacteria bacterium]
MANLNIVYYDKLAKDISGNVVLSGVEPSKGGEVVSYTTSTQSAAFPDTVRLLRLIADADAYVVFGADPTATASSPLRLEANVAEYFGISDSVKRVSGLKLAVYDGTS